MSEIDIRESATEVTAIKFADDDSGNYAVSVTKYGSSVRLEDTDGCGEGKVKNEDVPNFILALQKAQSLGWIK